MVKMESCVMHSTGRSIRCTHLSLCLKTNHFVWLWAGGGGGGGGGAKTKWKTPSPNFEELIESITNMLLLFFQVKKFMRYQI